MSSDKEALEIFEKIWEADIYNQKEPLYSMATSVVTAWYYLEKPVLSTFTMPPSSLKFLLAQSMMRKWRTDICRGYNISREGATDELREKYKHSKIIALIIDDIVKDSSKENSGPPPGVSLVDLEKAMRDSTK